MKRIFSNKTFVTIFLLYSVYAIIVSFCTLMSGDDFYWATEAKFSDFLSFNAENGRFFTNTITLIVSRAPFIKGILFSAFLIVLPCVMAKVINVDRKNSSLPFFVSAMIILAAPLIISSQTFYWLSGFTNYVTSSILIFLYIWFCMPLFRGEPLKKSWLWSIYTLLIGFLGAQCVENASFYCLCLGTFFIVYSLVRYKKLHISNITYMLGTVIGSILILSSSIVKNIIGGQSDSIGFRTIEFSAGDIRGQLYGPIIDNFVSGFFIVNIISASCVVILFLKKYKTLNAENCPKYAKILLPSVVAFAVYSLFSSSFFPFCSLTLAMRTEAIQTALTFIYFVAMLYLLYYLVDINRYIRCVVYMLSTVLLTFPFLFVNPVNGRCFLTEYLFWGLFAAELVYAVSLVLPKEVLSVGRIASVVVSAYFCIMLAYSSAANKYVDNLRLKFIKEQLDSHSNVIMLIELPYPDLEHDVILDFFDEKCRHISIRMCEYYGFDEELMYKPFNQLTPSEYFDVYAE